MLHFIMMKIPVTRLTILAALGSASLVYQSAAADKPGNTDTPMIPGGKWHVHDPNRPVPPMVAPGKTFRDGAAPPADAIVLFDGQDLSKWQGTNGPAPWKVQDGFLPAIRVILNEKNSAAPAEKTIFAFHRHHEFSRVPRIESTALADTGRFSRHSARFWRHYVFAGAFAGDPAVQPLLFLAAQSVMNGASCRTWAIFPIWPSIR
jgi:hypothetical protein